MQNRVGSLWKQLPTGIDERYEHMYGAWCQHVGWVVWVGGMHSAGAGCVSVRVSQCSFTWWKWWLEMDCNELKNVVTKYFVTLFWDIAIQYLWQFSCWKMGEDNQVLVSCHNYIVTNPTVSVSIGLWHIFFLMKKTATTDASTRVPRSPMALNSRIGIQHRTYKRTSYICCSSPRRPSPIVCPSSFSQSFVSCVVAVPSTSAAVALIVHMLKHREVLFHCFSTMFRRTLISSLNTEHHQRSYQTIARRISK